jgi:hypothetical protein
MISFCFIQRVMKLGEMSFTNPMTKNILTHFTVIKTLMDDDIDLVISLAQVEQLRVIHSMNS